MSPPTCASIERWEKAGASLVTALKDYMELCLNLGTESFLEGMKPNVLVSRIDSTLSEVHTTMSHHLNQSTSILARTRNKIVSLPFQLPEEVLSEIFMNAIHSYQSVDAFKCLNMRQEVWLIYRRLYRLLRVCSTWRDILLARGNFWSVIPIVSGLSVATGEWQPFELSLKRASGSALHLAAETNFVHAPTYLDALLVEHSSRFRTINIGTDDVEETQNAMNKLLEHNTHGSLSELSIRCAEVRDGSERLPQSSNYIVTGNSTHQAKFESLVHNLGVFRISGICVPWDTLTFSTRLTELRIQDMTLGYDDTIIPFIQALSSASNLRDLKIISVSTFRNNFMAPHLASSPVIFPALQWLFIEDLHLNTLEQLLPTIAPGSHHLTLFLSPKSLEIHILESEPIDGESEGSNGFDGLCKVLEQIPIDTLMISGLADDGWLTWLTAKELANLLKVIPALKTLKLEAWIFDKELCKGLTRVGTARKSTQCHLLPPLQNLHLTTVDIRSQKSFKAMIRSYPLRQAIIGGQFLVDQSSGWTPLEENSSVVQWLKWKMPNLDLRLVEMSYRLPEYYTNTWKLW